MKREILFRGKQFDIKEWVEGWFYMEYGFSYIRQVNGADFVVDTETVGQFTGLTDKNGKKIFEGDIIESGEFIMIIVWDKTYSSFCLDRKGWAFRHWFGESCDPDFCVVVGNIHDNTELL